METLSQIFLFLEKSTPTDVVSLFRPKIAGYRQNICSCLLSCKWDTGPSAFIHGHYVLYLEVFFVCLALLFRTHWV
jgi:hypothetical protein